MSAVILRVLCVTHMQLSTIAAAAAPPATTVTIAPGVEMPLLNMGVVANHSTWLALGGRGLDTALTYGDSDQRDVGRAVRESGLDRKDVFVTTKVPCCPSALFCAHYNSPEVFRQCRPGLPDRNYTRDVEQSLSALGLDYVDLLLLHWPCDSIEESVRAYKSLEPLVGRTVRALGVSNFNASALSMLLPRVSVTPAVNQAGFSVGVRHSSRAPPSLWGDDEATVAACKEAGITYSAYSPLGGVTRYDVLHDPVATTIATAHNRSSAQIALRYLTQRGIPLITSSDSVGHVTDDLASFEVTLSAGEMAALIAA